MIASGQIKIHFIEQDSGKMIAKQYVSFVPRVGDECRFHGEKYYKVTVVVFVYDENGERANIGLERLDVSEQ